MSILSIYVSAFNLENGLFDWKDALDRFYEFGDELVIGTTSDSKDNTINLLNYYIKDKSRAKLIITDFSLNSPTFDGDIKNAALQATTLPAKILLDLDEFPLLCQKEIWISFYHFMISQGAECMALPSINLCGDMYHYKDIAYKFYLHRDGLHRGVVKHAKKQDGSINISISDTTEPLNSDDELPKIITVENNINYLKTGRVPFVFHKWAVDLDKRIGQNKFWSPVWANRAKKEVNDIILDKKQLEKIEVFEHNLPLE